MTDLDLVELLCARLCHDMINPVGAICNGLELVLLDPASSGEDLRLIDDSARAAQAALSFYRLAFGLRGDGETAVSLAQIGQLAHDYLGKGRLALALPRTGPDLPRPVAKLVLLMLLAGASAAPVGGQMVLATPIPQPLAVTLAVEGHRVGMAPEPLALLQGERGDSPVIARDAHLLLLPKVAATLGASVRAEQGEDRFTLRVGAA